jgi:hypothetical protein
MQMIAREESTLIDLLLETEPLSAEFLLKRGYCCGNGCKNCPYTPRHTKGTTKVYNIMAMNSLLFLSHLNESKAMSYTKAVLRTIFYQYFLLFIGISVGFIVNAEWVGWKSNLVERSFYNIFFPVEFDEEMCAKIKGWGLYKLYAFNDCPADFKLIEDGLLGEEFYIAKFQYTNKNGDTIEKIDSTRVRWKTWEYYYTDPEPWTEDDINDYMENGTLNSHESDKALRLYQEMRKQNSQKTLI